MSAPALAVLTLDSTLLAAHYQGFSNHKDDQQLV